MSDRIPPSPPQMMWRDFRVVARRAGRFPIHVVAEWLGNSPEVVVRHYLRAEARHYLEASGLDGRREQGDNAANGERLAPASQAQVG